jgi:hypothetical protein
VPPSSGYAFSDGSVGAAPLPPGAGVSGRINYAPVFTAPQIQWASPPGAIPPPPVADGNQVLAALRSGRLADLQTGKLGVDLAVQLQKLRQQDRVAATSARQAAGRTCLEVGGVWIDEGFDAKMPSVVVKAQGKAYFRLLERHPEIKEVFQLGNRLIWVTPSRTVLMIDAAGGKEDMTDAEIDRLFVVKN